MRDVNKEFSPWRNYAERKGSIAVRQVYFFQARSYFMHDEVQSLTGNFHFKEKESGVEHFPIHGYVSFHSHARSPISPKAIEETELSMCN